MILFGGGGSHLKDHKRSQDHNHEKGGGALKKLVKLKVPIEKIITLRIRYQWVIQDLTNIDLIRIALTKSFISWNVV